MRGNLALSAGLLLVVLVTAMAGAQTIVTGTEADGVLLP